MATIMARFSGCEDCHVVFMSLAVFLCARTRRWFPFRLEGGFVGEPKQAEFGGSASLCVSVSDNCTHVSLQYSFTVTFQLVYAPRWAKVAELELERNSSRLEVSKHVGPS